MMQSSNSWSSPTANTMTSWMRYCWQPAMYDQAFLSLQSNQNLCEKEQKIQKRVLI
nr:MAG TPA: hypothetical protein [Bacteriophage sp.]